MTVLTTNKAVSPARRGTASAGERAKRLTRRTGMKILIAVLLVVEIYPLLWLVLNSLKTKDEIVGEPLWWLPHTPQFGNYLQAFANQNIGRNILNSISVTLPSLAMIIVFGAAAGFALEVMVWRGRNATLFFIVGGMMVPLQMLLLPLFTIYFKAGISDTQLPLIITYVGHGLPLTVFLFATYFRAIPREIFEASTLDGGGPFRAFFSIGLPLVRNGVFTVGLLMFFSVWNDLLIALTFNLNPDLSTIQVGLLHFSDEYGAVNYGPLFAAISTLVLGTLGIYLAINQQVMKGVTAGSVKG